MKLKEQIYTAVNQMNMNELVLLYEHIRLLKEMKQVLEQKRSDIPIEKILEMTSTSESCWSDTVIQAREDRV